MPKPDAPAPGPSRVARAGVDVAAVDVTELARLVADAHSGAVVTFAGVVRDHDGGRRVSALRYEGHPGAGDVVALVAADVVAAQEAAGHRVVLAVVHRVGDLQVGDCALGVAVAAAHRAPAFAACEQLVEEVKLRLPVWKRQQFTDGSHEWVGSA